MLNQCYRQGLSDRQRLERVDQLSGIPRVHAVARRATECDGCKLLRLLTAAFGTDRPFAALQRLRQLTEVFRTCPPGAGTGKV
jgi:hypothetical protein